MAEPQVAANRPDIDIRDDVVAIIVRNPPLASDQHHLNIEVIGGTLIITGHTKSPINRRYLVDRASLVDGVKAINVERFYDDESIRLEIGQKLPEGVLVNVQTGIVVLSGTLPAEVAEADLAERIANTSGVTKVVADF